MEYDLILEVLHQLEAEGKIPESRPDLYAALRERDQALKDLDQQGVEPSPPSALEEGRRPA